MYMLENGKEIRWWIGDYKGSEKQDNYSCLISI